MLYYVSNSNMQSSRLERSSAQLRTMVKKVTGYTKAVITSSCNERSIFYAHPCFQGEEWYDWAMIHFEEINDLGESIETYYPSLLHGFIIIDGEREAVVQCSLKPLDWDDVERNFIQSIQLGTDFDVSYVSVQFNSPSVVCIS